ncbi:MAG: endolytic transglycosylase MltG [Erythrobacter sp.]
MSRLGLIAGLVIVALIAGGGYLVSAGLGDATIQEDSAFVIPAGASLSSVAGKLEEEGHVSCADGFLLRARLFGSSDPIQAGEFLLETDMDQAQILSAFQNGDVIRRFVTIPEGMPSVMVHDRLMAEELLTGEIEVPVEGSILPDTYSFERGESRQNVIERMQSAMDIFLAEAWAERGPDIAVETMRETVILASIVEKESGKPEERGLVAGLYSNRVKAGMLLQADPTIIYPITQGRALGRRIRQSEIAAFNDYNTYTRLGLPAGPITNPGRESIAAVLNPEPHDYLFMVADGTGGHEFNVTNAEHDEAVGRWFALRRERGEIE